MKLLLRLTFGLLGGGMLGGLIMPASLLASSHMEQKKFDKQIDAPFFKNLTTTTPKPDAKRTAPLPPVIFSPVVEPELSSEKGSKDQAKNDKPPETSEKTEKIEAPTPTGNDSSESPVDLAFGAYQRGFYLTALDLALPRAESGDPAAQTLIAELYFKGLGVKRDRKAAAVWYRFAADSGNREAQFAYASMLIEGKDVPLNKKLARLYLEKAAKAGHAKASFNLAQIIVSKKPSHAGFVKAFPYYRTAAQSELPDAQYALANIYATGRGIAGKDPRKARKWMKRAAIGGLIAAQVELAIWIANGKGGKQDEEEALLWFKRAAARGNAIAFNRLAKMYLYGIGTKSDRVVAASYHVLAKRQGNSDSELENMFRALEDIDKKRAIELANRWRKL